jgi:hypothetical protein
MFESAYFSRRLDIDPDDLAQAATHWHRTLPSVRWAPRFVRASDSFWLDSNAVVESADRLQRYGARGVLWSGGRPVPVNLEFSIWSETRSEVGVGPRCLSWPVGTDRYVRLVRASLEIISQAVSWSTRRLVAPREVTTTADLPLAIAPAALVPHP